MEQLADHIWKHEEKPPNNTNKNKNKKTKQYTTPRK